MKRKIKLRELASDCNVSELDLAIGIHILLENPQLLSTSRDPVSLLRKRVDRAKKQHFFEFYKKLKKANLMDTLTATEIGINFWYSPRNGNETHLAIPMIIKSFHPKHSNQVINLLIDRNNFEHENCFSENLSLMIKMDDFFSAQTLPKSFINCVATYANVSPSLFKDWPSTFSFFDERVFAQKYGFGYEIYVVDTRWCPIDQKVVTAKKRIYKSSQRKYCLLQYMQAKWPIDKHEIKIYDMFILRQMEDFKIFYCPNQFCFFNTFVRQEFDKHTQNCSEETKVNFKQLDLVRQTPKSYLISKGLIPSTECFNAAFWDIECLMKQENIPISEYTFLKNTHKIVSISVTINFGPKTTKIFKRADYSEYSLLSLLSQFWSYLKYVRDIHFQTLTEHSNALSIITDKLAREPPISERQILYECKTYLQEVLTLKAYAWNGESYDIPIIFGALLKYLDPKCSDKREDPLDVIKRGLGFMSVTYNEIKLSDAMLFFPNCSLDKFGTLFKANVRKLTFCYEYFNSISEAEQTTVFPSYKAFKSSFIYNTIENIYSEMKEAYILAENHFKLSCHDFFIKLDVFEVILHYAPSNVFPDALHFTEDAASVFCVSIVTYVKSWIQYDIMKHNGECHNMADYLYFYNTIDTQVLSEGFTNLMHSFKQQFNQNLIEYASLPSVSYAILWEHYSTRHNHPYSFAPEYGHIAKEIRSAILGGLAGPLHTHVEINSPVKYTSAVHFGPNGLPYIAAKGWDAGSKWLNYPVLAL